MTKDFIERFNEENNRLNTKLLVGLGILCLVIFTVCGCTNNSEDITSIEVSEAPQEFKQEVKVGNDGVNAAIAKDDGLEPMKAVAVEDFGRSDPFMPVNQQSSSSDSGVWKQAAKPPIDLLPPPQELIADTTATELIKTKVSGIMYDRFNPSAILNIKGEDYLIRTGDVINGYKILSIGKDEVMIQFGSNIYKAGVGEMFTGDGIHYNTVSNLENKFGGRKNP